VSEVLQGLARRRTHERAAQHDVAPSEIRRKVQVVDAQAYENAAAVGSARTDPPKVDGEDFLASDQFRERTHDRVESLGVADEQSCSGTARAGCNGSRIPRRRAKGLFDKNVSPCGQGAGDDRGVGFDGCGDDDHFCTRDRLGFPAQAGDSGRRFDVAAGVVTADQFETVLQRA
jgi:hypothetical protein